MEFFNKIINENCLTGLKMIPDGAVNCCVTSPPSNVKKANIATKKDQIIYSLGATTGGLSGLFITSLIL